MKMSKAERKAYNLGRQVGRTEGYADGLHDGNPFITIAELVKESINVIADKLNDPEFIEYLQYLKVEEEDGEDET